MPTKVKRMNLDEFRKEGYFQELNRLFLHPLGLALEVVINKDGEVESLGGIWDYRADPEGILFPDLTSHQVAYKAKHVKKLQKIKGRERKRRLGFVVQPIGNKAIENGG